MKTLALASSVFAVAVVIVTSATAGVTYSGTPGPTGNSGVDAFGNDWNWNYTQGDGISGPGAGFSAWGSPGLGDFVVSYGSVAQVVTEFTVTFTPVFSGTTTVIDQTPSSYFGGYDEETRFEDETAAMDWTPVYTGGLEVTFVAPSDTALAPGDVFFVNVIFTGSDLNGGNTGFTAEFGTSAPPAGAPEPTTWTLALIGLGVMGAGLRATRHARLKAA